MNKVRQIVIKNRLKCPKAENQIHLCSGSGVSEFPQNEFIVYFVEKAPVYDQCIVGLEIAHTEA